MAEANDFANAQAAAKFLLSQTPFRPRIGLVLGSGLGGFADDLADAIRVPFTNVPFFARSRLPIDLTVSLRESLSSK